MTSLEVLDLVLIAVGIAIGLEIVLPFAQHNSTSDYHEETSLTGGEVVAALIRFDRLELAGKVIAYGLVVWLIKEQPVGGALLVMVLGALNTFYFGPKKIAAAEQRS